MVVLALMWPCKKIAELKSDLDDLRRVSKKYLIGTYDL
jgi:hypothetical protein